VGVVLEGLGGEDGDVVVINERARQQGGEVQVERPQPEARTNELDAGAGWRTLDVEDDRLSCELASRDARSAPGSLCW
jgi:hypothetical protein